MGEEDGIKKLKMKKILVILFSIMCFANGYAQPTIVSFAPTFGSVGTSVALYGSNFNALPSFNIVYFGGTRAVVDSVSIGVLYVKVPVGATNKSISVTDSVSSLTGYSFSPFKVVFSCTDITSSLLAPKITVVTPETGVANALGDLDGDGKLDLVSVQSGTTVSVFRNTSIVGVTSFSPAINFLGFSPRGISIGDLDGDGKLDLVVGNYSGAITVSVFRNISTVGFINFAPKLEFIVDYGPWDAEIVDIDGDGKPEIVSANNNVNSMSVLRNTSSVGFISFATKIDFSTYLSPCYVAYSDFDGDGKTDVAISGSGLSVFKNTSSPGIISFLPKVDYPASTAPITVTASDIDGDGPIDLAVTNASSVNKLNIYRNISTLGTIDFSPAIPFNSVGGCNWGTVTDMDGDKKPDAIVAGGYSNQISIFKNTSVPGIISFDPEVLFATGNASMCLDVGDVDGDGRPDISSGTGSPTVDIFRNSGTIGQPYVQGDSLCVSGMDTLLVFGADGNENYKWYDSLSGGSLLQIGGPSFITPVISSSTNYFVTKFDTLLLCESFPRVPVLANVNLYPSIPSISMAGTLLTSSSPINNQWYYNGVIIPGANAQNYSATMNGNYHVVVTSYGCSSSSSVFNITNIGIFEYDNEFNFEVSPNPFSQITSVSFKKFPGFDSELRLIDVLGRLINKFEIKSQYVELSITDVQSGIYYFQLFSEGKQLANKKIIIK